MAGITAGETTAMEGAAFDYEKAMKGAQFDYGRDMYTEQKRQMDKLWQQIGVVGSTN